MDYVLHIRLWMRVVFYFRKRGKKTKQKDTRKNSKLSRKVSRRIVFFIYARTRDKRRIDKVYKNKHH